MSILSPLQTSLKLITAVSSPVLMILGGCCCVLALLEQQTVCSRLLPVCIISLQELLEVLVGPMMESKLQAIVGFQLNQPCKIWELKARVCTTL